MSWFRKFARALLGIPAPSLTPVPAIPKAATWTQMDRDNWKRLLESPTGRKLVNRLRATEYMLAVANAKDQVHTQHSAGVTTGYGQCMKHLISLSISAAAPEPAATSGGESGETPTAEREAEELLQRMSP